MKRILSVMLVMALLLTVVPVASAENGEPGIGNLWGMSEWSFLVDMGVLTAEEAALLSADKAATEAGLELIRTGRINTGNITGTPEFDDELAALMARAAFEVRLWRNGAQLTLLADGETVESAVLGEKDGLLVLESRLLPSPLGVTVDELSQAGTLIRLTGALRANGLISQDDARHINTLLLTGGVAPWPVGLLQSLPWSDTMIAGLDLTAWNEVLAGVQSRMTYTDGDDGTRVWTLEVTPEDLRDFIVAGLIVLRDSPELNAMLPEITGFNQSSEAGKVSFNDAFILPLLAELEGADTLMPFHTRLEGHEDAEGSLVRLEIEICNADEPELPVELRCIWSRRAEPEGEVYELLLGDNDVIRAYISCTHITAADGERYVTTLGSIGEDGSRMEEFVMELGWQVSRGEERLFTQAEIWLNLGYPGIASTYAPEDTAYRLSLQIAEDSISIVMDGERKSEYAPMRSVYTVHCDLDGAALSGTESFTMTSGTELLLEYTADLHTAPHVDDHLSGVVVRLSNMSDELLTGWIALAKANAETWLAEQQSGWLGEMIKLWEITEAEEEPVVTTVTYNTIQDLRPDNAPEVTAEGVVLRPGGAYDWEWSVLQAEEVIRVNCEVVPDFVPSYEGELPPPGSGVSYHLTFEPLQAGSAMLLLKFENMVELDDNVIEGVDTPEGVAYLYEIIVDEDGNITVR